MQKIIIFGGILLSILVLGFVGYKYFNSRQVITNSSDSSLSNIKERGKLIVGINVPFGPMEYYDQSGKIVGFDIDLITKIASDIGVVVEIKDVPWIDLFNDLKMEKFDVIIDSITITDDRQKEMLFSSPYLSTGQVIVVRKDNIDINKPEDLKGKKVSVFKNTTCEDVARRYADLSLLQSYEGQDVVTHHLKNKDADAMIVDYIVALNTVKENPDLKMVTNKITEEYYGIATKLGNNALMDEINSILREIKRDGQLKQIEDKWLK